jgi:gentisate 1,2-dioxygenase
MLSTLNLSALTRDGLLYDYREAANPIQQGLIAPVPYQHWSAELHQQGPTQILPLDLSADLGCEGPATSPALCANFVHILPGESLKTTANATSQLFYVIRGAGSTELDGQSIPWQAGDLFTLPANCPALHHATADAAFYWVHDEPLLTYLGVLANRSRFRPTLYRREELVTKLQAIANDPSSARANRLSVLLGNQEFPQTRTVTHTIWAMFGLLPIGATQAPHRHQSVALDLILDCQPGCYTLVGSHLDEQGQIKNPTRVDWQPGAVFVTPPGHWHSHHNESGSLAHLLPIQDAGLQTYLRTLNILFARQTTGSKGEVSEQP